jgi:hypothetical protein
MTSLTARYDSIYECIDRGLDKIGGLPTRLMIFTRLEAESNFNRQDTVFKPAEFKKHLEMMFVTGSKLFERAIVQELVSEFKLDLQSKFDLVDAIEQSKIRIGMLQETSQLIVA